MKRRIHSLFFQRLLAFILDLFLINLVIVFPFQNLILSFVPNPTITSDMSQIYPLLFIISILSFFYFLILEYLIGATVGKIVFNLKIISNLPNHEIRFIQVFLRNLIIIPFFPFSLFWIADGVHFLIKKERFLDFIAKTKVVKL